jgi:alkaline phosphatase
MDSQMNLMKIGIPLTEIGRRDWLKTAGICSAASILSGTRGLAATAASAGKVRGVVFMVSDGMSPGVLTLAESYSMLTRKRGTRWWQLFNDRSAARGLMDTASASSMVTDSAAASSAWGGGQRVNNGEINVDAAGREITPIAAILKKKSDTRIGLVTTATVTHATPAGFAASVPARGNEMSIAPQYLNRVDVILGGGKGYFDPKQRPDKRDLAGDFVKEGYQIIGNRNDLLASRSEKLLGTFTTGHLPFSIDRDHDEVIAGKIPTLTEMAMAALSRFLVGDKPFLLQIEGARIDHAAHLNDIAGLLGDQLAFDDAIAAVLEKTAGRDDILVVVTSDHGNSNPGLSGTGNAYGESTQRFARITRMKSSHEKLFGEWRKIKNGDAGQLDGLVNKHLDFNLHPTEAAALLDILNNRPVTEWSHQLEKPEGLLGQFAGNHTGIGWVGTSHTSDPTLVSATGPQAERFSGMVVNTDVFTHLMETLGGA